MFWSSFCCTWSVIAIELLVDAVTDRVEALCRLLIESLETRPEAAAW